MNDVKKKIYLIVGITLLLLGLSSTFAWVIWFSEEDTDVNFAINGLDITSTNVDISGTIYPTNDKTKGIVKEFTVVQNSELNSSVCADFTLTLTNLPTGLIHESFKYEIYNGETLVGKGHFGNSSQGDIITIATSQPVTTTISTYKIYIWIDGLNYENPYEMFGQNFSFTLGITANQQDGTCSPSEVVISTDEACFTFDSSTGTITDYLCYEGNDQSMPVITDVVIPVTVNGEAVTTIGYSAFDSKNLTSVVIPNGVTTIERAAFEYNDLTSVTMPDSVTTIGPMAFNGNNLSDEDAFIYARTDKNSDGIAEIDYTQIIGYGGANRELIIPDSVTTMGQYAFAGNNLTSVVIPDGVVIIGENAFWSNYLTRVTIPDSVTSIGNAAFMYNKLESVYIGTNSLLTSIGEKILRHQFNSGSMIVYNNSNKAFDWNYAVNGTEGTPFIAGQTIDDGVGTIVTITTGGTP